MTGRTVAVGVDGTRGGWIAVRLAEGRFAEADFFPDFADVLKAFPEASVIAVDIPIGLPPRGRRQADQKAKDALKARRNSVFFVPPRPALEAPTFQEAIRIARSLGGSISQQIYALRPTPVAGTHVPRARVWRQRRVL